MITVTAAIIFSGKRILLTRRAKGQKLAGFWEFPGGKLKAGEGPRACLERELREELNIDTRAGKEYAESIYHYPHVTIRLKAFITHLRSDMSTLSLKDHDEISWAQPEDLLSYKLAPADIPIARKLSKDEDYRRPEEQKGGKDVQKTGL